MKFNIKLLIVIASAAKQSLPIIALFILFSSCGSKSTNEKSEANTSAEKQNVSAVTITEQQFKAAEIEMGKMEYRNLTTSLKTTGRLSLPPQNKASVSTPFGGIVKEIKVNTGQLVTKGTILAIIENPDIIQLQQDYLENASHLDFIESDYERQKILEKDNITSQKHLQETEADYRGAVAKDNALKAKLELLNINTEELKSGNIISHLTIIAPISGYVQDITTNIGTFAEPNMMLFEIINNSDLHLDLQVFEKDVRKIEVGQKVIFAYVNAAKVSKQDTATIFAVDKEFDPQTQAITVHAHIENYKGIMLPGMYVDARIIIDKDSALSVPDDAIVSQGDEHYIFIAEHAHPEISHDHNTNEDHTVKEELGDENTFLKIAVSVGSNDMGYIAITPSENISLDSRVVVKGAYALLSEMNKGGDEE